MGHWREQAVAEAVNDVEAMVQGTLQRWAQLPPQARTPQAASHIEELFVESSLLSAVRTRPPARKLSGTALKHTLLPYSMGPSKCTPSAESPFTLSIDIFLALRAGLGRL